MTSQGYLARKSAFPAWALAHQPSLGWARRLPAADRPGTACGAAARRNLQVHGLPGRRRVAGRKRTYGDAAALKCSGVAGPAEQDKREESANG